MKTFTEKQKEVTAMLAGMQKTWEEHCTKVAIYRASMLAERDNVQANHDKLAQVARELNAAAEVQS